MPLSEDEKKIWEKIAKTVQRTLPDGEPETESFENLLENETSAPLKKMSRMITKGTEDKRQIKAGHAGDSEMDRKTLVALKRGNIRPERTIDLHGLSQEQAHSLIIQHILIAYERGQRCLLVITGKGRRTSGGIFSHPAMSGDGVLKSKLPLWLNMEPVKSCVLKHVHAHAKDGGSGAFYVYLRRKKSRN